jgi:hypothetical protein
MKQPKRAAAAWPAAAAVVALIVGAPSHAQESVATPETLSPLIRSGKGSFVFRDPKTDPDRPVTVWYFLPPKADVRKAPILFVMHGTLRNGEEYRDQWTGLADRYNVLLLVPQFSREHYPGGLYNRGNVRGKDDEAPLPPAKWTFPVVEHLFDHVKAATRNRAATYDIYGHSAGGQFVHRLALFTPGARFRRAVAANAGYYTLPLETGGSLYPFSLEGTAATTDWLKAALGRELVILLGEGDTDPKDPDLYHSPEADKQGLYRLARGKFFFEAGRTAAEQLRARFRWRMLTVPGVGHSNARMAEAAAQAIYGPPPSQATAVEPDRSDRVPAAEGAKTSPRR